MLSPQQAIPPSHKPKTNASQDDFADIAQPVDDFADIAQPHENSLESITANPKNQGTYKMLPTAQSPYFKEADFSKGEKAPPPVMVPYGNIKNARDLGFAFAPNSGDDERYAHDLFTELQGKGQAPKVEDDDEQVSQAYGVVPTPSAWSKEWSKRGGIKAAHAVIDFLPTAFSIGGAALTGVPGAATGPGDIAIASLGAAGGGATGEAAKQTLNHYIFGEIKPFDERQRDIAKQFLLGGLSEGGGRIIALPLGGAAKYFGFTADESANAGIRMLHSEASGKAPTWLEEFLKGSVLSKGIMERFRDAQNKESVAAATKLMDSISTFKGTPEQLGLMVQKGLEDSEASLRAEQNMLYGALDDITEKVVKPASVKYVPALNKAGKPIVNASGKVVMKTVQVPATTRVMPSTVELKKFAQEQIDKINKPPYFLPPDALEKARGAFNTILKNPDNVSFKRMRDMRSVLLSQVRDLDEIMGGGKLGLAKKFTQLSDKSLEDAATNSGIPGLTQRWREANAITAEGHRMFEQKLVDKAAESENPEFIASLLGGKTIGLQQTRDLFKALPEKMHDPVRRGLLQDAVTKSTERSGAFNERKFADSIYKLGDERGKIIFGANWKNVKELSEILGKINGPVGLGGGGGASLQNVGIMRKLVSAAITVPATAGAAIGIGTGHTEEGLIGGAALGLGALATEAASARVVALAMANPARASRMLVVAREIARKMPYTPPVVYNTLKDMNPKKAKNVHDYIEESGKDLINKVTPSRSNNPAATGQVSYDYHAVHTQTGHHVISRDGRVWIDPNTGQQVG